MNSFSGDGSDADEQSVETFMREKLSAFQLEWIETQSRALGEARAVTLGKILNEWFALHPDEQKEENDPGEITRQALSEFIYRHEEEFLPVGYRLEDL